MQSIRDKYIVEVKHSHIEWGEYRNSTNREPLEGESYVKIPSCFARRFNIGRGTIYIVRFGNSGTIIDIKASGSGQCEQGIQYAKQFERIGAGACKAFTPWYRSQGSASGDKIEVKFTSLTDIMFSKI